MDLMSLRLNTIFKLKMLKITDEKLLNRVMRSNRSGVKNIINKYIRGHKTRESIDFFFQQFIHQKNKKFLQRLSVDGIKNSIAGELDSQLRNYFNRNMNALEFQKIVEMAISCAENCIDERVKKHIPQWIQENYKITKKVVINKGTKWEKTIQSTMNGEYIWNESLMLKKKDYKNRCQEAYELIEHLNYIRETRRKIKELEFPERPTGVVSAEEYSNYCRAIWGLKNIEDSLQNYIVQTENFLNECKYLPKKLKDKIISNDFKIKNKELKYTLTTLRKEYEAFILYEKYGEIPDKFWKEKQGAVKLVREPNIILDYIEENPALDLDKFVFNVVKIPKSEYIKFYKFITTKKEVKVINVAYIKDFVYFMYDYAAPKWWFKDKFFDKVEAKLQDKKFEITYETNYPEKVIYQKRPWMDRSGNNDDRMLETVPVEFDIPYYGNPDLRDGFTFNLQIFLNRNKILGLSEQPIKDEFLRQEGFTKKAINSYQIYYPIRKNPSKQFIIDRERKFGEYIKLYGSFNNVVKFTTKGKLLSGGNLIKNCKMTTGDIDLDRFVENIDSRKQLLFRFIERNDISQNTDTVIKEFMDEVFLYYKASHEYDSLKLFLRKTKRNIRNRFKHVIKTKKTLEELEYKIEAKDKNGHKLVRKNSKKGKQLLKEIKGLRSKLNRSKNEMEYYNRFKRMYKSFINKTAETERVEIEKLFTPLLENYIEIVYRRVITDNRDIISYCKLMTNNLNIDRAVKVYKKKDKFMHKFFNQYKKNVLEINNTEIKLSELMSAILKMAINLRDESIINDLFELLYNAELEYREQDLLTVINGL